MLARYAQNDYMSRIQWAHLPVPLLLVGNVQVPCEKGWPARPLWDRLCPHRPKFVEYLGVSYQTSPPGFPLKGVQGVWARPASPNRRLFPVDKAFIGVNCLCGLEAQTGARQTHPGGQGGTGINVRVNRSRARPAPKWPGLRPPAAGLHGGGCASVFGPCGGGWWYAPCVIGSGLGPRGLKLARTWGRSSNFLKAGGLKRIGETRP